MKSFNIKTKGNLADQIVRMQKEFKELYGTNAYGLIDISSDYVQITPEAYGKLFGVSGKIAKNGVYTELSTEYNGVKFITLTNLVEDK